MLEKHENLLSDLDFKIKQLMFFCDSLKEENAILKNNLNQKELEIELLGAKYKQLDQKYTNLKIAQTLLKGQDSESIKKAKDRLFQLVRDVDKCISLLKV